MRNPIRETWIESWEATDYQYGYIPIDKIDLDKSLANQARMVQPLIPETLKKYTEAMENNNEFPAITVYLSDNKGKYVIIDGNHRVHAALAVDRKKIDAYILDVNDAYLIEMMTRSANVQVGQPPSYDDLKEQAKYAVRVLGASREEAARRFNINRTTLDTALRVDEVDQDLTELGCEPGLLSETHRDILNRVRDDHSVLRGAFNLACDAELTTPELREVVHNIKTGTSESERLSLLDDCRQSPMVVTRSTSKSPKRDESRVVWDALTRVINLDRPSIVEYGITSTGSLVKFQSRAQRAVRILKHLLKDSEEVMP